MAKYRKSLVSAICELIGQHNLTITEACRLMRISRKTFYAWRNEKPGFREITDKACAERKRLLDSFPGEKITIYSKRKQV